MSDYRAIKNYIHNTLGFTLKGVEAQQLFREILKEVVREIAHEPAFRALLVKGIIENASYHVKDVAHDATVRVAQELMRRVEMRLVPVEELDAKETAAKLANEKSLMERKMRGGTV